MYRSLPDFAKGLKNVKAITWMGLASGTGGGDDAWAIGCCSETVELDSK